MPGNRGRNKSRAERLLEQVLVTGGKTPEEIQEWFEELYSACGATKARTYAPGTYKLHSKAPGNQEHPGGVDPSVKDYIDKRIKWSENPLPLGDGGH